MAKIGNLGKLIIFSVSDKKILTFSGLKQELGGRWQKQNIIKKKPISEFIGADTRTITMKIELNAMHGVRPRKMVERIEKAIEKGKAYKFVLNKRRFGKNKWVITKMNESWEEIMSRGETAKIIVSITLEEYL